MSCASEIIIHNVNNRYFIWNASDVQVLREDFRIVGTLVGCLPRAPRQNAHLGLPLELLPEEVTLLLEKGVATVVEKSHKTQTPEDIENLKKEKQDSYKEQIELFRKERREELKRNLPNILEGKKAKRNKLLEERRDKGETVADAEFEAEVEFDPEKVDIPAIREEHMLVQLHLESRGQTETHPVEWSYPHTPGERLRYKVFRDQWERGHFLTSGSKFGGDFLVYPGDPARFHSIFVAVCVPHQEDLSALDIITMGRLGTNVKKTVTLCSEDAEGNIRYTSLQWTGIT